jgi:hypothetical protein
LGVALTPRGLDPALVRCSSGLGACPQFLQPLDSPLGPFDPNSTLDAFSEFSPDERLGALRAEASGDLDIGENVRFALRADAPEVREPSEGFVPVVPGNRAEGLDSRISESLVLDSDVRGH